MKQIAIILSVLGCMSLLTQCDLINPEQTYTLSVSQTSVSLSSEGGTFNDIRISTNGPWTAAVSSDWVKICNSEGSSGNNQVLFYEVSSNASSQSRTSVITVQVGTAEHIIMQEVSVYQEANAAYEYISRWYPTNCGTEPNGDMYVWNALPTCPSGYHIPTGDEVDQLCTYPSVWVTDGPGGISGRWFCPTEDATANPSTANGCVFFPAVGYGRLNSDGTEAYFLQETRGCYWTSTLSEFDHSGADILLFLSDNHPVKGWSRIMWKNSDGSSWQMLLPVRCVR